MISARSTHLLGAFALAFGAWSAAQAAVPGDVMADWRNYARGAMQPAFEWAADDQAAAPTLSARVLVAETRLLATELRVDSQPAQLKVSFGTSVAGDSPNTTSALGALHSLDAPGIGLVRQQLATGIEGAISERSLVSASVVLVNQQFASFGLGIEAVDEYSAAQIAAAESSVGTGVRVGFQQTLSERFSWSTDLQSRINMESFQSYRGVFADPGNFDIPGQASVTARWTPTPRFDLALTAERVFYSDLVAFSSAALPVRFLALLGDGTSPEFKWRDLDVLVADAGLRLGERNRISLRYSTQQQPDPTSALLRSMLAEGATNTNFVLGFEHRSARFGRLRLAGSYAPAEAFFGNISALARRPDQGAQLEGEASWRYDF
ncbi:MAG: hypothetical protein AB7V26_12345 [Lysobacterales bacterium]